MRFNSPVIQIALDYPTIEESIDMARLGVEAGVDWLEVGTPLIVCQGIPAIGALVRAFPGYPVLADYKTMDSGGKNVERTAAQGGHIMTVCANAPDETIQSAVAESKKTGVWVIADTIGVKNQAARSRQCEQWGVNIVYLHYGAEGSRVRRDRPSPHQRAGSAEGVEAVCKGSTGELQATDEPYEVNRRSIGWREMPGFAGFERFYSGTGF